MVGILHLSGLWGIVIAQPLFSVLGQSPEFFVAHNIGPLQILLFAVFVVIGVPIFLACGVGFIAAVFPKLRLTLQSGVICVLLLIGTLAFLNLATNFKAFLSIPFATSVAIAGAYVYWRSIEFRGFFSVLAPIAFLFPTYFLFFSPVSTLVLVNLRSVPDVSQIDARIPVVLVVLDELSASSLQSQSHKIDAARFPNLASVAEQAHWFPNAISAHPTTPKALPAILTGLDPSWGDLLPPSHVGHPENLFKWLGSSYQMNIFESVTSLCPPEFCEKAQNRKTLDAQLFLQDLYIIFAHLVVPPPYSDRLPRLDQNWKGFAQPDDFIKIFPKKAGQQQKSGRIKSFENFIAAVKPGTSTLDFVHVLLPHVPYEFGRGFSHQGGRQRELQDGGSLIDDNYLVAYSQLLYLHQLSSVDDLIGKLVARLKAVGKYEDALLIIAADHGVSYKPGGSRRELGVENAPDILNVPLLVKLPNQLSPVLNEQSVLNLDIVATIADVLDEKVPWENEGHSILADDYLPNENVVFELRASNSQLGVLTISQRISAELPKRYAATESDLNESTVSTKYDKLLGTPIEELHSVSSDVEVKSGDIAFLNFVNLNSGFLPILVRGELLRVPAEFKAQWIAIGLNGKIEAVAPLYNMSGDSAKEFRIVLPPRQIKEGRNALDFFLIENSSTGETFIRVNLNAADNQNFELFTRKGTDVIRSGETQFQFDQARVRGYLEIIRMGLGSNYKEGNYATISGWATHTAATDAIDLVLLFSGDKLIYYGSATDKRPDVAEVLGDSAFENSGFRFLVPGFDWESRGSIRGFAITRDGYFGSLNRDIVHAKNPSAITK